MSRYSSFPHKLYYSLHTAHVLFHEILILYFIYYGDKSQYNGFYLFVSSFIQNHMWLMWINLYFIQKAMELQALTMRGAGLSSHYSAEVSKNPTLA